MAVQESLTKKYGTDAADQQVRLAWVQFTEQDAELIRSAGDFLRDDAPEIAREFYEHSFKFPEFVAKVEEAGSNRQTLEGAQAAYFCSILDARIDEEYFEHRLRIGETHARLDIKPRWNLGNYATYADLIIPRLAEHLKGQTLLNTIRAFLKVFFLDGSLAVESYITGGVTDRLVQVDNRLGPSATTLSTAADQTDIAAKEIAGAIQEIAQGAADQTESMASARGAMEELTSAVGEIAQGATDQQERIERANVESVEVQSALSVVAAASSRAAERSEESQTAAEDGMRSVSETVDAMETINAAVVATSSQIAALSESGKEIGAITQTISEIADQTNLLALNAAIEAARAGDMGRGFAVVADEVRSLAERSASAAQDIASLIETVQQGMDRSVEAMAAVVQDVETGAAKAREAGDGLQRIVEVSTALAGEVTTIEDSTASADASATALAGVIEAVGELAQENNTLADRMREQSKGAMEQIDSATAAAEQTAASSQQVSAGAEEVTAQVGEIAAQALGLSNIATELNEFLDWIGAARSAVAPEEKAA